MAILIKEFDIWRQGYGGATVTVKKASDDTNASIYTDEALSVAADNPQTLLSDDDGNGKFSASLYVGVAYYLDIDSTDNTGVIRPPLTTLDAEDASDAVVTATGGSQSNAIDDIVDRVIHAEDYGLIGAAQSAATNTATITAAIGAAAGRTGTKVGLPAGNLSITQLTLSAGVRLRGEGRAATTLTSTTGDAVITISGDRAGLEALTLDGSTKAAGSIGIYSKANDEIVLDDVEVKRFETGIHYKGGRRSRWTDLTVTNCATGVKGHGDDDAGGGADGDAFQNNRWIGGRVRQCTTIGLDLSYEDLSCLDILVMSVGFEDNTGTALNVNGARRARFESCWMSGNTTDLAMDDDSLATVLDNTVIGFLWSGGFINGGAITFTGTCQDVVFEGCAFEDVDFTLTSPTYNIVLRDCTEDADVTISGDGVKLTRWQTRDDGFTYGATTDATATKAWAVTLKPGQKAIVEAKVIGNQQEADASGEYWVAQSGERALSTLDYDAQTANFTPGLILTGGTSGATALIVADSDSGTTGTLSLKEIKPGPTGGYFEDNETITDSGSGSATANGALSDGNCAMLGSLTNVIAVREDVAGWAVVFTANGPEIELTVQGASGDTVDWTVWARAMVVD